MPSFARVLSLSTTQVSFDSVGQGTNICAEIPASARMLMTEQGDPPLSAYFLLFNMGRLKMDFLKEFFGQVCF